MRTAVKIEISRPEISPKLHLIRGVPGSGKTTFAKSLGIADHYEADQWFSANGGFVKTSLPEAHKWCYSKAVAAMEAGRDVVVSNTFCKLWEMQAYLDTAWRTGHLVIVSVMTGRWDNLHHVPEYRVKQMLKAFEPFIPEKR